MNAEQRSAELSREDVREQPLINTTEGGERKGPHSHNTTARDDKPGEDVNELPSDRDEKRKTENRGQREKALTQEQIGSKDIYIIVAL